MSAKTDLLEHSEKSESPTSNYDMDVELGAIYKLENQNYDNSNMTWMPYKNAACEAPCL